MDIYSAFKATADRRANHTALTYLGTRFTYRQLDSLAERFSAALTNLGIEPGQRVILYIPNSVQWVVAWLGVLR